MRHGLTGEVGGAVRHGLTSEVGGSSAAWQLDDGAHRSMRACVDRCAWRQANARPCYVAYLPPVTVDVVLMSFVPVTLVA